MWTREDVDCISNRVTLLPILYTHLVWFFLLFHSDTSVTDGETVDAENVQF